MKRGEKLKVKTKEYVSNGFKEKNGTKERKVKNSGGGGYRKKKE